MPDEAACEGAFFAMAESPGGSDAVGGVAVSLRLDPLFSFDGVAFETRGLGVDLPPAWLSLRARENWTSLLAQLAVEGNAEPSALPFLPTTSSAVLCWRIC